MWLMLELFTVCFMVTSLAMEPDCPSASEALQKEMGEMDCHLTTAKCSVQCVHNYWDILWFEWNWAQFQAIHSVLMWVIGQHLTGAMGLFQCPMWHFLTQDLVKFGNFQIVCWIVYIASSFNPNWNFLFSFYTCILFLILLLLYMYHITLSKAFVFLFFLIEVKWP